MKKVIPFLFLVLLQGLLFRMERILLNFLYLLPGFNFYSSCPFGFLYFFFLLKFHYHRHIIYPSPPASLILTPAPVGSVVFLSCNILHFYNFICLEKSKLLLQFPHFGLHFSPSCAHQALLLIILFSLYTYMGYGRVVRQRTSKFERIGTRNWNEWKGQGGGKNWNRVYKTQNYTFFSFFVMSYSISVSDLIFFL